MVLARWKPFRDLFSIQRELDRAFGELSGEEGTERGSWLPTVDISETEEQIKIRAEVPGVKKEDINLNIEDNVLSISGEKKVEEKEEKENYHRVERSFGCFKRSIYLPDISDQKNIKAQYNDGVLTVSIPKKEEAKKKAIPINIE